MPRIACVSRIDEFGDPAPDIAVFPEYTSEAGVMLAARLYPDTVIVAAIRQGRFNRGFLLHRGRNLVNYRKADSDGTTDGAGIPAEIPFAQIGDFAVAMLICKDVDVSDFLNATVARLRAANALYKVLCIPAYMGSWWFQGMDNPLPQFAGVTTALCNHPDREGRARSFIRDSGWRPLALQADREPIVATV
ncbi:MAG: hypothetical protein ISS15_21095 [Alphaproteobacteria bacterium]|nr:hypothetical protein [Reyranella sp.]MBL6940076.1 hypothetical protein [Alphaproteobacteria bacterium]MBL7100163.1 hypothetical protein [Alphaproteobacteria bacterium]